MSDYDADIRGIPELVAKNKRFAKYLLGTARRSLKKGLSKTATSVRREYRGDLMVHRIALSPWGKLKGNRLTQRIKALKLRITKDDEVAVGLGLYGYAAVSETGDRIPAHVIRVRGRLILHPGAAMVRHGFGGSAVRRDEDAILRQLDEDLNEVIRKVYGE